MNSNSLSNLLYILAVFFVVLALIFFVVDLIFEFTCDKNSMFSGANKYVNKFLLLAIGFGVVGIYMRIPAPPQKKLKCVEVDGHQKVTVQQ